MSLMRTLSDARDAGLVLVAICHNQKCRHGQLIDLDLIIHHMGGAHSLVPTIGHAHFSERMRCPICRQRGMYIWAEAQKNPQPMLNGLGYSINNWDAKTDSLISIVAKASNVTVAHAAFEAALSQYPGRKITLQEGAHLLKDSRLRAIAGGKKR